MSQEEEKIKKELILRELYYDNPKTKYRSPQHLWELAKEEDPDISKYFVKQWLLTQSAYTRFKKWNNPRHFRHTMVRDFDQLQMDLVVKMKYPEENEGYENILVAIEILSRYAFVVPLQTRYGIEVKMAVEKVINEFLKRFDKYPKFVQFDEGGEFLNKDVIEYLDDLKIEHFSTPSPRKASVVERFNRTLKSKMMRMFEHNGNYNWTKNLQDLVDGYNNTVHSSIGMKPEDVKTENKFTVWGRLFGHLVSIKKPKYDVGDKVRVLKLNVQYRGSAQLRSGFRGGPRKGRDESKKTLGDKFREKYQDHDPEKVTSTAQHAVNTRRPPFSVEIFDITRVLLGDPNVYKLYSEEFEREVLGIFYEEELSLVKE